MTLFLGSCFLRWTGVSGTGKGWTESTYCLPSRIDRRPERDDPATDFRPCRGRPGDGGGATLGRGRLYGLKVRCGTDFFGPGVKVLLAPIETLSSSESEAAVDNCRAILEGAGDAIRAILAAVDCRRRAGFFSDGGGGMSMSIASSVSLIGLGLNAVHALATRLQLFDRDVQCF